MNYSDAALRNILAAEYALGSLHGAARARFERLLRTDDGLLRLVEQWQEDLASLATETRAVVPPAHVLAAIQRRIATPDAAVTPGPKGFWQRLAFWRSLSAASASIAAVLAVLTAVLMNQPAVTVAPSYVAVLQNQAAQPVLVVTAYRNPFRLKTEPIALPAPPAGHVVQIWAVDKGTGATRPLAVAAADAPAQLALSDDAWKLVRNAQYLVASIETAGPTREAPTAPLIYSGVCINLKGT